MSKDYVPNPIDTSKVILHEDLLAIAEQLARNTHENWAKARLDDGWRFGPERNDARREHPCLVPYDELTEEEKNFDRITTLETLKTIVALGWSIEK